MLFLHDMYVVVPTDKALKIAFVCKSHYIHCLIKELCIDNALGNPTYTPMTPMKEEILDNRNLFVCALLAS